MAGPLRLVVLLVEDPEAAVLHCTSPGPITPPTPVLSWWATLPSQARVTVSNSRCG